MISLKKHMEAQAEELLRTALNAYRAAITAIANAGAQAIPSPGAELRQKLNHLQQNLPESPSAGELTQVRQDLEVELGQWGEHAAQYTADKEREMKEIMVAVAAATEALGHRDQRYKNEFTGLTTKLHSIAKMEDLTSIRRSVVKSAMELKAAVVKMAEEGEQSISELRAEVAHYRTRLEQSKKREALDALTGLVNRREIESQMEERISWGRPFCLAILDLNDFKKINDEYGHMAGDDALRQFAEELKAHFRSVDIVSRWGGDEFVVIIEADPEEARVCLDRVRQWVFGEYTISGGQEHFQVVLRASIGMAVSDSNETAVELMARADKNMYAEKKVTSIPRSVVA